MPFKNDHSCRLRDPGDFEKGSFVRTEREHEGKKYGVIQGRLEGEETLTDAAFRYPKETWSVSSARSHCTDHDGILFEPASAEASAGVPAVAPLGAKVGGYGGRVERRAWAVTELRVEGEDGERKIVGHAAVFDKLSVDLWGFRETIAPGAFKNAVKGDVRALWNHDSNFILGRTTAGTLRLEEDRHGLAIEIDPPETQFARDLMVSIDRGDVTQMSFAFATVEDRWEKKGGENIRTLIEVELFDVSPVVYPAYPQTDVGLRSLETIAAEGERRLAEDAGAGDKPESGPHPRLNTRRRWLELVEVADR